MTRKSSEDLAAEARIRAHIREQMEERGIDKAELSRLSGIDDGNLSRIMRAERGIGLGVLLRLCKALKITPTRMLEQDPPERYWDDFANGENHDPKK